MKDIVEVNNSLIRLGPHRSSPSFVPQMGDSNVALKLVGVHFNLMKQQNDILLEISHMYG